MCPLSPDVKRERQERVSCSLMHRTQTRRRLTACSCLVMDAKTLPSPGLTMTPMTAMCGFPNNVPHARHNGDEGRQDFPIGSLVEYECFVGYNARGFSKAKCLYYNGTAQWFGPDLKCIRESSTKRQREVHAHMGRNPRFPFPPPVIKPSHGRLFLPLDAAVDAFPRNVCRLCMCVHVLRDWKIEFVPFITSCDSSDRVSKGEESRYDEHRDQKMRR